MIRLLTAISLAVLLGCSYYTFVTLGQLMSHLDEIERVARMGNPSPYHIVSVERD